ncbi:acyltransferase family protein [Erwinia sp. E_sp_B04_7]|uniref:acyltransferase family protein n=1 Tax=unclassified Erwinia TaxID=2622719 RepID=UPI0030CDED78
MDTSPFLARRNIGLDFLRAVLILEGVLYHAARSLPGSGNYWYYVANKNESIAFSSLIEFVHAFRMEAFFFLSGMFSAMVILRKGRDFFIDNRKKRVLLPLVGAFLFIPPLMYLITASIKGNPLALSGLVNSWTMLHHLWFLVSLSVMSLIVPVSLCDKIAALFRSLPLPVVVAAIIISCNLFFAVKYVVKDMGEFVALVPVTARFFIYYAAGYALYVNRDKIPQIKSSWILSSWFVLPMGLVTYLAFYYTLHNHIEGVMKYIPTLIASVFSVLISFWLVFFFEKIRINESRLVKLVVDSALVVYIMHYPVVISFSYLADAWVAKENAIIYVALITSIGLAVSFLLYYMVKRSKLLSALFGLKPVAIKPVLPSAQPE